MHNLHRFCVRGLVAKMSYSAIIEQRGSRGEPEAVGLTALSKFYQLFLSKTSLSLTPQTNVQPRLARTLPL